MQVDRVEDVLVGDAVPARGVVNLHLLIVIRKGCVKSFPDAAGRGRGSAGPINTKEERHAVEMAHEGVPLVVIQRQLGHANLGITSVYLQGIDSAEISTPSTHDQHPRSPPRPAWPSDSRTGLSGPSPTARSPLSALCGTLAHVGQMHVAREEREYAVARDVLPVVNLRSERRAGRDASLLAGAAAGAVCW